VKGQKEEAEDEMGEKTTHEKEQQIKEDMNKSGKKEKATN
jgi:hypothetical protein